MLEENIFSLSHIHTLIYSMMKDFTFSFSLLSMPSIGKFGKNNKHAPLSPMLLLLGRASSREYRSLCFFKGFVPWVPVAQGLLLMCLGDRLV